MRRTYDQTVSVPFSLPRHASEGKFGSLVISLSHEGEALGHASFGVGRGGVSEDLLEEDGSGGEVSGGEVEALDGAEDVGWCYGRGGEWCEEGEGRDGILQTRKEVRT